MSNASGSSSLRDVGCDLMFAVTTDALLAIQVAPATSAGTVIEERFEITDAAGTVLAPEREISDELGGRIHLVPVSPGVVSMSYVASIQVPQASPSTPGDASAFPSLEAMVALRQSRYCPSDALAGFAAVEFGEVIGETPECIARCIASWVFERFAYEAGSSGPLDTAVETLLSGAGVCRDFAHLTIALCRALDVPARLAAVYAPGLAPMDFHAVVEVLTSAGWQVLDPTRLAPRSSLVRIATGRDAADTSFATTLLGEADLVAASVFASSSGDLPEDDHVGPTSLN